MIPTCEADVFILEQREGYTRYVRIVDGETVKEWEVLGICTDLGFCYQGAVNPKPELDCPVNEFFKGCCDLTVNVVYDRDAN